jgi:hypothetical protein
MRYPVADQAVSNPYGWITDTYFHAGVDFPGQGTGTPLVACLAFTIHQAPYWSDRGGWSIALRFEDGVLAWYQHMREKSHLTDGGSEGALVGYMGNTGSASSGPHLHFETRRADGVSFDPIGYLNAGIAAGGGAKPFPPDTTDAVATRRRRSMSSLYYMREGDTPTGKPTWALAGDSPGTPANWLETNGQTLANSWAGQHGNAALLSTSQFRAWRDDYRQPLKTT